jgi:phytoene dehydrogenase-like protein
VRLAGGERVAVDGPIASNADPRHLGLDLMGEAVVGQAVAGKLKHYEWGPSFFGIYAALDRPVPFKAGREPSSAGYIHASGPSLDQLARSFADLRAGLLPTSPMVGVIDEAARDPSRAPEGRGLMKFIVHFVPYSRGLPALPGRRVPASAGDGRVPLPGRQRLPVRRRQPSRLGRVDGPGRNAAEAIGADLKLPFPGRVFSGP